MNRFNKFSISNSMRFSCNFNQLKLADSSVAAQDRKYVYDAAWNLAWRTNDTTAYTFTENLKGSVNSNDKSVPCSAQSVIRNRAR